MMFLIFMIVSYNTVIVPNADPESHFGCSRAWHSDSIVVIIVTFHIQNSYLFDLFLRKKKRLQEIVGKAQKDLKILEPNMVSVD